MGCAAITTGSDACSVTKKGGTEPVAFGFNIDDISGWDADGLPIMKATKVGYIFKGYKNDMKPTVETINKGVGPDVFKHNFGFMIYDKTTASKTNIKNLVQGKTVWIYEANGKDANSFQVLGKDSGLVNVPGVIQNPHENLGVYVISLSTGEEDFEDNLPGTAFDTDYATTLAAIIALCTP